MVSSSSPRTSLSLPYPSRRSFGQNGYSGRRMTPSRFVNFATFLNVSVFTDRLFLVLSSTANIEVRRDLYDPDCHGDEGTDVRSAAILQVDSISLDS